MQQIATSHRNSSQNQVLFSLSIYLSIFWSWRYWNQMWCEWILNWLNESKYNETVKFERFVFVQADDRLGLWVTLHIRKGARWHIVRIPWSKGILRVLECLPYCKQWLHCTYKLHTSTVSISTPEILKCVATIALINDNLKSTGFQFIHT